MKDLLHNPLFYFGLIVKVILILSLSPSAVTELYVPFLGNGLVSGIIDPWSSWLANSGSSLAFPYGYSMWFTFLPLSLLSEMFGISLEYGYLFTLLICDIALLCVVNQILDNHQRLVLFAYWLSPVVTLATYGLGLNDVIPALYLMLGIWLLRLQYLRLAGVFFGLAISAKLSMLIALPLVFIYLYNNKPLRHLIYAFSFGLIATFALVLLPFLFSSSALMMLFTNPEMKSILSLSFDVGKATEVYFLPILFAVILYLVWRVRRLNFDLFMAVSGVLFLVVVILMPAASGWFVWTVPFLVFYQALSGRLSVIIIAAFSGFFVLSILFKEIFYLTNGGTLDLSYALSQIGFFWAKQIPSIIDTGIFAIGIILAVRMWRESISDNDFFRQSKNPFVIGISGDSGSGKDTFSDAVKGLFGDHSTVSLSGDDYHLWDRHKPMWQVMTHLNPLSNDLDGFSRDLLSLVERKSISSRLYDHATGKMSKPVKIESNDFILASGLHTLYLPEMRDCCNLKIFLEMEEGLRRHLKIKRDVEVRGHPLERVLESIEFRKDDTERYISSQKKYADIVLSLQPIIEGVFNENEIRDGRQLKVVVTTFKGISDQSLNRALVGLCGLHVDMNLSKDGSEVCMTIEGDAFKEDIEMAAKLICPKSLDFLDINPKWHDGALGIMQLVAFFHIDQVLTKRYLT